MGEERGGGRREGGHRPGGGAVSRDVRLRWVGGRRPCGPSAHLALNVFGCWRGVARGEVSSRKKIEETNP